MKFICRSIAIAFFMFFIVGSQANATSIINSQPLPGWGKDDGSTLFRTATNYVFFEKVAEAAQSATPQWPSIFGFYYNSQPNNLIDVLQGKTATLVDFGKGLILDPSNSYATLSTFTPLYDKIGLFYWVNPGTPIALFTDPARNNGVDLVATFPNLVDPTKYIVGYELFNPSTNDYVQMAYNVMGGLVPSPVPEPGTFLLLGMGCFGAVILIRRNRRSV